MSQRPPQVPLLSDAISSWGLVQGRDHTVTSCPKCAAEQLPWGPAITRLTAAEAAQLALDSINLLPRYLITRKLQRLRV